MKAVNQTPKVRLRDVLNRATVYRLYDVRGNLLYIGSTTDVAHRFAQHAKVQPWWSRVVWVSEESFNTRDEAYEAEGRAIALEDPKFNVRFLSVGGREARWERIVAWRRRHAKCLTGSNDFVHIDACAGDLHP
jgi:predicted GIY-YIG superfamily endonuclease